MDRFGLEETSCWQVKPAPEDGELHLAGTPETNLQGDHVKKALFRGNKTQGT